MPGRAVLCLRTNFTPRSGSPDRAAAPGFRQLRSCERGPREAGIPLLRPRPRRRLAWPGPRLAQPRLRSSVRPRPRREWGGRRRDGRTGVGQRAGTWFWGHMECQGSRERVRGMGQDLQDVIWTTGMGQGLESGTRTREMGQGLENGTYTIGVGQDLEGHGPWRWDKVCKVGNVQWKWDVDHRGERGYPVVGCEPGAPGLGQRTVMSNRSLRVSHSPQGQAGVPSVQATPPRRGGTPESGDS